MSKASVLVGSVGLSLVFTVTCAQQGTAPSSGEVTATSHERIVIGPDLDPDGEEDDFEVSGLPVSGYVYPRDFPAQQESFQHRSQALQDLHAMRTNLGIGHFDPDGAPVTAGCDTCFGDQACLFNGCRDLCPHSGEIPLRVLMASATTPHLEARTATACRRKRIRTPAAQVVQAHQGVGGHRPDPRTFRDGFQV